MSVTELSMSTQNYLKAVWDLAEWSDAPVTATVIAEKTGFTLSSVSDAVQLNQVSPGSTVVIERISDDDPDLLKFFEERGIVFAATLHVSAGAPYSDALDVQVGENSVTVSLGHSATDALYVSGGILSDNTAEK